MRFRKTAPPSGEKSSDTSKDDGITWGPKLFWTGMALMLGLFWYVIIYSGGASPHGSY